MLHCYSLVHLCLVFVFPMAGLLNLGKVEQTYLFLFVCRNCGLRLDEYQHHWCVMRLELLVHWIPWSTALLTGIEGERFRRHISLWCFKVPVSSSLWIFVCFIAIYWKNHQRNHKFQVFRVMDGEHNKGYEDKKSTCIERMSQTNQDLAI